MGAAAQRVTQPASRSPLALCACITGTPAPPLSGLPQAGRAQGCQHHWQQMAVASARGHADHRQECRSSHCMQVAIARPKQQLVPGRRCGPPTKPHRTSGVCGWQLGHTWLVALSAPFPPVDPATTHPQRSRDANRNVQHADFQSGHPRSHRCHSLNFRDRTGSGAVECMWPRMRQSHAPRGNKPEFGVTWGGLNPFLGVWGLSYDAPGGDGWRLGSCGPSGYLLGLGRHPICCACQTAAGRACEQGSAAHPGDAGRCRDWD